MKPLSKQLRRMFISLSLLLVIILAGLSLPTRSAAMQTESTLTPTPTILYVNGEPVLQSGDTQGLILGAGVILLIILAGVAIQRILQNKRPSGSD